MVRWFFNACDGKVISVISKIKELLDKITSLEDKIELEIENKIEDMLNEKFEREKRKSNVVIFGIQEAGEDINDPQGKINYDLQKVKDLHGVSENLKTTHPEIEKVVRLGKKKSMGPDSSEQ